MLNRGYNASLLTCVLFLAGACGKKSNNGPVTSNICSGADAPAGCGKSCGSANLMDPGCAANLFCGPSNTCTAECRPSESTCGSGYRCSNEGKCVSATVLNDGGTGGTEGDSATCATATPEIRRRRPRVIVLIDRSGSMCDAIDGSESSGISNGVCGSLSGGKQNRWEILKEILIGTPAEISGGGGGFIKDRDNEVMFGLVTYTFPTENPDNNNAPQCPSLEQTATPILPSLQIGTSYTKVLQSFYPSANPIGETPTGDSIVKLVNELTQPWGGNPVPSSEDPIVILLATDGKPDRCEKLNPNSRGGNPEAFTEAEQAVQVAYGKNIKTYVLFIGTDDPDEDHLRVMANRGQGYNANDTTADRWYQATTKQELNQFVGTIVDEQIRCDYDLTTGTIDLSRACEGTVTINNNPTPLKCNDPNGWRAVDADTIEVVGQACDDLRASPNPSLNATFPCGVFTSNSTR